MKLSLLAAAAGTLWCLAAAAQAPSIQFRNGDFIVSGPGFDAEPEGGWGSLFRVFTGNNDSQPILGSYLIDGKTLVFRPRFPAAPNVAHRAVFRTPEGPPVTAIFDPAPQAPPSTRVDHVYPSAGVLPGNVLKLYITFSAPMSRGEAWQHIHLLDEAGKAVDLAFLEIEQELWDPGNRRLTVLFDPGRIKRGLVPSDELGTPIVEGKSYTLLIDADWHDAQGAPLLSAFRKTFRGGPVDRTTPDPKLWRISAPKAGSSEPLVVEFHKPMDYALLQRLLAVKGVEGAIQVDQDETRWLFTPAEPWKPGSFQLIAHTALEDISGNRLDRPFDVDTLKYRSTVPRSEETVPVPFTVH